MNGEEADPLSLKMRLSPDMLYAERFVCISYQNTKEERDGNDGKGTL